MYPKEYRVLLRQRAGYIPVISHQLLRFSSISTTTLLVLLPLPPCSILRTVLPSRPSRSVSPASFCALYSCIQPFPLFAVCLVGIALRTAHQPACSVIAYSTRDVAGAYIYLSAPMDYGFFVCYAAGLLTYAILRAHTHPCRCFPSTAENSTCPLHSLPSSLAPLRI